MQKNCSYKFLLGLCISIVLLINGVVFAHTKTAEQVQHDINTLEKQVDQLVTNISTKEQNLAKFQDTIQTLTQQIGQSTEEIYELTDIVKVRKNQAKNRLIALQIDDTFTDILTVLFTAESITDFIERLVVISELQHAANKKLENAQKAVQDLEQLKIEQAQQLEDLKHAQSVLAHETETLKKQKEELSHVLTNNREQLDQLAQTKLREQIALEQRLNLAKSVAVKQEREDETVQMVQTSLVKTTESSSTTQQTTSQQQVVQVDTKQDYKQDNVAHDNSKEFEVEATAYSYTEPGLTPYTATGLDLRINSQVIAVDPSVIKLGSLVHVHGYGVYLAADTGGAIKGRKIDIHMNTVNEANHFGRRKLKITILN